MIGEKIKIIREARGITLSTLADRSGVSKSYLSNLERGLKKNPSIQIIENVAYVLNTNITEFLDRNQETQYVSKEWSDFVKEADKVGIEVEMLENYKEIIEFIKWKKKSKEIQSE